MKYTTIITFLFLFTISYGQTNYESGVVEFGVNFNNSIFKKIDNTRKKGDYNKRALNSVEKLFKSHKKIYSSDIPFLKLCFTKHKYILKPIEIMLPENLQSKFIFQSDVYYVNFYNDNYLKHFKKRGNTYIAPFKKEYNWEIKNEQKTILGYQCRKAVLEIPNNNKIIAWFTPQISIAFSPVKYYGLPGAILDITTPMKHIYAKNIEFTDDVEIEKPTEGIKLSKEEYQEMISRPDEIPK